MSDLPENVSFSPSSRHAHSRNTWCHVFTACSETKYGKVVKWNIQGSHRLEKYLNLEGFHEKTLKTKYALKILENHSKALKSPWILLFSVWLNTVDRDLNQYKIVVPLFGAAFAHQLYTNFLVLISPLFQSSISEVGSRSSRVLDSRPKDRRFEPHQRHCVVVLEQDTFILA